MGSKLLWPAVLCLKESPRESNYGMSEAISAAGHCWHPGPGQEPASGEMEAP